MTIACKSGKHHWISPDHARYCCNGWHLELRVLGDYEGAEPDAPIIVVHGEGAMKVWVRDLRPDDAERDLHAIA